MPHKIVDVVKQIMNHPNYSTLGSSAKSQLNGALYLREYESAYIINESNQYIRGVWKHLYWREPLPYG